MRLWPLTLHQPGLERSVNNGRRGGGARGGAGVEGKENRWIQTVDRSVVCKGPFALTLRQHGLAELNVLSRIPHATVASHSVTLSNPGCGLSSIDLPAVPRSYQEVQVNVSGAGNIIVILTMITNIINKFEYIK